MVSMQYRFDAGLLEWPQLAPAQGVDNVVLNERI